MSFDDFQNFHPHLHGLATDGCFYNNDTFMVCPSPDTGELEKLFRCEVFKMLKAEGKITDVIIENMMNWRYSGFNVYCSKAIWRLNEEGLENLARYIFRASLPAQALQRQAGFSQERTTYIAAGESANCVAKVIYEPKDGKASKTFDALDWPCQRTAGCKHSHN